MGDHVPMSKRMSFRPMVSKKLQEQKGTVNEQTNVYEERFEYHEAENGVRLPAWWAMRKDAEGRTYYINDFKKLTQWEAPTEKQIRDEEEEFNSQLPPPEYDPTT